MQERIVVKRFTMDKSISDLFNRLKFDTQEVCSISLEYFFQFTNFLGSDGEEILGKSDNSSRIQVWSNESS